MSLYLWLDLLSLSVPLLVSFHPRIQLHKRWPALFSGIVLVMIPYIIWDVYFTRQGFWGFNEAYLSGIYLFDLPLEEWLFFICIPYACVFTHVAILKINPRLGISADKSKVVTLILLGVFLLVGLLNLSKAYTLVDMTFAFVILLITYLLNPKILRKFYLTFLFMLIPFLIVNGILTGSGIVDQVVWYNDAENLGIRVFTIPIEDFGYAFSMILFNLFFLERFTKEDDHLVIGEA